MIVFESISKQFGSTLLFDKATFSLNETCRTGLIGCNGSGKTTILKMISGVEQPDSGSVTKPSDISIGYLPQEVELYEEHSPMDIVLESFKHLLNYEESLAKVTGKIEEGEKGAFKMLEKLHTEMEQNDGFSIKSRAEMILSGLGLSSEQLYTKVRTLSGGYRMRAVLGKLLLENPDYLILDEPTNHLDFDSLVWLEKFLSRYKGGMLIVSHDRDFLNRITTHTANIQNTTVRMYKGNYEAYLTIRREQEIADENRAKNLQAKIAQNERFVQRFKAQATKATQAQSRIKQIENLRAELPDQIAEDKSIRFSFSMPKESGSVPIKLTKVTTGYSSLEVISKLFLEIRRGDKIAIIGPNGAGKSTLLKLFSGILPAWEGELEYGHNAILRYFGQHQLEQLHPEKTALETISENSVSSEKSYLRGILGSFLFSGDAVDKKVKVLSGGEKSRLVLATILASPGNVLLLDEPTNHLDVRSIEMLAESMAEYKGTIAFVSHDEFFISKVANRIVEVRPGVIRDFPGNLNDYRYYMETLFKDQTDTPGSDSKPSQNSQKEDRIKARDRKKKLVRQIERYERGIEAHEEKITELESVLNDSSNATNFELLGATTEELSRVRKELAELLRSWEEANLELEG